MFGRWGEGRTYIVADIDARLPGARDASAARGTGAGGGVAVAAVGVEVDNVRNFCRGE